MSTTTSQQPADFTPASAPEVTHDAALARPIGFIGLGAMGLPMAVCLVRSGRAVLGCDADPARLSMFVDACGAADRVHTTPVVSEVADRCDVVILMLPTSTHVRAVVHGTLQGDAGGQGDAGSDVLGGGLVEGLQPGALIIDMGSSIPGETRRLAQELAQRGLRLIDAPVSGGVPKARDGTLAILVGGAEADVADAMPLLQVMGEAPIRTGAVGSGHAMKALNNFVYAAGLLAVAEAVRVGEAAGLDLDILADVLNASSGRNVATETKLKQFILSGRYAGGFKLGLMAKDLETAGHLAQESGVPTRALDTCRAVWQEALAALGPDVDNTEIHRCVGA